MTLVGQRISIPGSPTGADKSETLAKDLKNLKIQHSNLRQNVESLQAELNQKSKKIAELELSLKVQKEERKKAIDELKSGFTHEQCEVEQKKLQDLLNASDLERKTLQERLLKAEESHASEMKALKEEHGLVLLELQRKHTEERENDQQTFELKLAEKDKHHEDAIKDREGKIENLKNQIAGLLQNSSQERQEMINELVKELERVSDECNEVKSSLRNLKTSNTDCQKCKYYEAKIEALEKDLKLKSNACDDLMRVCSKMEKQLSQQDELLGIWKRVKGDLTR